MGLLKMLFGGKKQNYTPEGSYDRIKHNVHNFIAFITNKRKEKLDYKRVMEEYSAITTYLMGHVSLPMLTKLNKNDSLDVKHHLKQIESDIDILMEYKNPAWNRELSKIKPNVERMIKSI
jgi:hypothetical protein